VARRTPYEAGQKFIHNLNVAAKNRASRFVWKAVENDLPALQARVVMVVQKYEKIASYRLVKG